MRFFTPILCTLLPATHLFATEITGFHRSKNTVRLELNEGSAEIEWVSSSTFRFARSWTAPLTRLRPINRNAVSFKLTDLGTSLRFRTEYVDLEILKTGLKVRAKDSGGKLLMADQSEAEKNESEIALDRVAATGERYCGLGLRAGADLDARGSIVQTDRALLISSLGYGLYYPAPGTYVFDLGKTESDRCRVMLPESTELEYFFYYGPAPKEILEEHKLVRTPLGEFVSGDLQVARPNQLPKDAVPLPSPSASGWEALAESLHMLLHASFSGVLVPALDLGLFRSDSEALYRRASQLGALTPIVYDSRPGRHDAWKAAVDKKLVEIRKRWTPYLLTYFDEARDRGLPIIRPLAMQFARDAECLRYSDEFMVGDEVLAAPVYSSATRRTVYLPMGIWTDLRTNQTHKGRQVIEIDAPAETLPLFARNGSIFPLARTEASQPMMVHYFPRLAGEFFLPEPDLGDITQFHAAPAGELLRLEIESKKDREYEWVAHHTGRVIRVVAGDVTYLDAKSAGALHAGAWYYDQSAGNLHVRVRAPAYADVIVNVTLEKPM
jgi:alpha-glucosidase (family GH31 glycosyl hydrolase)